MTKNFLIPALALGAALAAHAQAPAPAAKVNPIPTKIGIIHMQEAIVSTKDGQKAANELQSKFAPRKAELEKQQGEITGLQDQLKRGSATMSDDAKNKIVRDIDARTTSLKRSSEDYDSDVQDEEGKLMQELGAKLMKVVDKYATDNGLAVVLDVSNPQSPVIWRATATDITADVIAIYDKANPATASGPASRPSAPAGLPAPSRTAAPPRK